ncbi:MAG: 50S ribosomal protein L11 methyltransferase [Thalassolituus sp.]
MSSEAEKNQRETLNRLIQNMHPAARVSKQSLPQLPDDGPDIKLWLVEPESMRRQFTQDEILQIQAHPAYWAFCWASGQVLAAEILRNPHWVAGKKVMDFGAGSGVVAIACVLAGAKEVIACDIDPEALTSCEINAELNGTPYRLHGDLFAFDEDLDLLIAADVLYDRANLPLLDAFLEKAPEVLVADSRVKDFNFPPYRQIGEQASFTVPDLDELDEFRHVRLYHAER